MLLSGVNADGGRTLHSRTDLRSGALVLHDHDIDIVAIMLVVVH